MAIGVPSSAALIAGAHIACCCRGEAKLAVQAGVLHHRLEEQPEGSGLLFGRCNRGCQVSRPVRWQHAAALLCSAVLAPAVLQSGTRCSAVGAGGLLVPNLPPCCGSRGAARTAPCMPSGCPACMHLVVRSSLDTSRPVDRPTNRMPLTLRPSTNLPCSYYMSLAILCGLILAAMPWAAMPVQPAGPRPQGERVICAAVQVRGAYALLPGANC